MTDEELNQKLLDIETNAIQLEAEQAKQAVGEQYGKSGFYRNLNPSEDVAVETESQQGFTPPPGGFSQQNWSTFGNMSASDPSATKFPLNIGSGNIEQLYDPSKIT